MTLGLVLVGVGSLVYFAGWAWLVSHTPVDDPPPRPYDWSRESYLGDLSMPDRASEIVADDIVRNGPLR